MVKRGQGVPFLAGAVAGFDAGVGNPVEPCLDVGVRRRAQVRIVQVQRVQGEMDHLPGQDAG